MSTNIFQIEKDVERVKFVLNKRGLDHVVLSGVGLDLDFSGSMEQLVLGGTVQKVVQRLLPLALVCDTDGQIDVWGFSTTAAPLCQATRKNYHNLIEEELEHGHLNNLIWGGTEYADVIRQNLIHFGLLREQGGGFWNFGRRNWQFSEESSIGYPIIMYLITDGENTDENAVEALIRKMQDAQSQIYFVLVGVGTYSYSFLKRLAKTYPNVGFVPVENLESFVNDDGIYEDLIPEELCVWLRHEHDEDDHDGDHHDEEEGEEHHEVGSASH